MRTSSFERLVFFYFLFNKKINKIILSFRGNTEGKIRIHIDSFDGALIGQRKISINNDQWSDTEVPIKVMLEGTHGISVDYSGDGCIEFSRFTVE